MCCDVVTGIAEKLIPALLAQTSRFPTVLPDVIVDLLLPPHFRVCVGPHVSLIFRNVAGTHCPGSSTFDHRMELAGFSNRGRCVGGSSARSTVRSLAWLLNCL